MMHISKPNELAEALGQILKKYLSLAPGPSDNPRPPLGSADSNCCAESLVITIHSSRVATYRVYVDADVRAWASKVRGL